MRSLPQQDRANETLDASRLGIRSKPMRNTILTEHIPHNENPVSMAVMSQKFYYPIVINLQLTLQARFYGKKNF